MDAQQQRLSAKLRGSKRPTYNGDMHNGQADGSVTSPDPSPPQSAFPFPIAIQCSAPLDRDRFRLAAARAGIDRHLYRPECLLQPDRAGSSGSHRIGSALATGVVSSRSSRSLSPVAQHSSALCAPCCRCLRTTFVSPAELLIWWPLPQSSVLASAGP